MLLPVFCTSAVRRVALLLCLGALGGSGMARASAPAGQLQRGANVGASAAAVFADITRQRLRACEDQQAFEAPPGWTGGTAQCAWQGRLRMRSWTGPGGEGPDACVSTQAQWWAWARRAVPGTGDASAVWHGAWTGQSLTDNVSAEKRIFTVERLADGNWRTTQWRWNPSPKAATRRWQEGRWAVLAAQAASLRQDAVADSAGGLLRPVLLHNAGPRVAEIGGAILNYQTDGLCLQVDTDSPGAQLLQVPYAADDSRLEQRAAMQLQLARRFPKATWLTPFSLLPTPAKTRGGAKFYAVWMENSVVKGQIWIPTKGDGALVRARITIALPAAPVASDAPQVAVAQRVIERELTALAARWAVQYE